LQAPPIAAAGKVPQKAPVANLAAGGNQAAFLFVPEANAGAAAWRELLRASRRDNHPTVTRPAWAPATQRRCCSRSRRYTARSALEKQQKISCCNDGLLLSALIAVETAMEAACSIGKP